MKKDIYEKWYPLAALSAATKAMARRHQNSPLLTTYEPASAQGDEAVIIRYYRYVDGTIKMVDMGSHTMLVRVNGKDYTGQS